MVTLVKYKKRSQNFKYVIKVYIYLTVEHILSPKMQWPDGIQSWDGVIKDIVSMQWRLFGICFDIDSSKDYKMKSP
jgi:hypothetical protein